MHFELVEEGEVVSYHEARLSELGLDRVADRVEFFQGDATNLKPQFTGYDLILAANLIDRLYDPKKFLETIHERLNLGGVLVITSPYTWLEEFTKKENWLGGFRKAGEPYLTLDALRDLLSPHFVMLDTPQNVEFVHSRNATEISAHGRGTDGLGACALIAGCEVRIAIPEGEIDLQHVDQRHADQSAQRRMALSPAATARSGRAAPSRWFPSSWPKRRRRDPIARGHWRG